MKSRMWIPLVIGVFLALGLALAASAQQRPRFITFDPSGSQGTYPSGISDVGVITGDYYDSNNVSHGFVRTPDGEITTFDAPGAGSTPGLGLGTFPYSITSAGAITGFYYDSNSVSHGFVRTPDGEIRTFDAPGAGSTPGSFQGTYAGNINVEGEIAGDYIDSDNVYHGFLRTPHGNIVTFNARGAGTGAGQGTSTAFADGINLLGAIPGAYEDANNVSHGFVRTPLGSIITFDAPGAGTGPGPAECYYCPGTVSDGINVFGVIVGTLLDNNTVWHGYVRTPDGFITTFEAPDAGSTPGSFQGTVAQNINAGGAITGYVTDGNYFDHGFVRSAKGQITVFDAPGAGSPPGGEFYGTVPYSNNDEGAITGYYNDATGFAHGFLRTP
jgi:hypothetical protein